MAVDLVRLRVDLIVTSSTRAALAAKHATTTIPIVVTFVADPVGSGLVASLGRPAGNVTGVTRSVLTQLRVSVRLIFFPDSADTGRIFTKIVDAADGLILEDSTFLQTLGGGMGHKKLVVLQGILASLLLAACASAPARVLSSVAPSYATLPNGYEPLNPTGPSPIYAAVTAVPGDNLVRYLERKRGHALNVLSLSGGGQNGAFGAGFLVGWRESGRRPQFDAVGGISTGALLATHAFLGTPADDAILEQMYTQITKDDIYKDRGIFSLAFGADSLKDTAPLHALLVKYVTAETLKRVAEAYDDNRMLFVGTTNIDYGQTWIWNMTLIAKAGDLELYRNVLLASASFPIVFPPVEIDGHLFVDGAARSNLVVPGMFGSEKPNPPLHGPGNLYLIDNGRVTEPPAALVRSLGPIAAETISVMMEQSMQTALTRSYFGTRVLGYSFKMVGIPGEVNVGNDVLAFDQTQMRAAFDAGRALAKQPDPWKSLPPDSGDIPSWAFKELVQ